MFRLYSVFATLRCRRFAAFDAATLFFLPLRYVIRLRHYATLLSRHADSRFAACHDTLAATLLPPLPSSLRHTPAFTLMPTVSEAIFFSRVS